MSSKPASSPRFNPEYYDAVIQDAGYDRDVFETFHQDLPGVEKNELEQMFLCHLGLYDFRDGTGDKAVLTGFGLSGVPHLGTLSQIHRAGVLNRAGYHTEVILGDLDAYNGKGTPLKTARQHAGTYARFIAEVDMLDPINSVVRNQYDNPDVLRTAYLIGRYAADELLENTEEDLHEFYARQGKVEDAMSFRRKLSLNLMMADFFHLGQTHPNVLVMLGLDEHKYVRASQTLSTIVDEGQTGLSPVAIHSIYTPIIRGLKGYPKMSKSFPESGITLDMPEEVITQAVLSEPDDFISPSDSVVMQIISGIGLPETSITEAMTAAHNKSSDWEAIKQALITRLVGFANTWQAVSDSRS